MWQLHIYRGTSLWSYLKDPSSGIQAQWPTADPPWHRNETHIHPFSISIAQFVCAVFYLLIRHETNAIAVRTPDRRPPLLIAQNIAAIIYFMVSTKTQSETVFPCRYAPKEQRPSTHRQRPHDFGKRRRTLLSPPGQRLGQIGQASSSARKGARVDALP